MARGDLALLTDSLHPRTYLSVNRQQYFGCFQLRCPGDFGCRMVRCHSLASALQHEKTISQPAGRPWPKDRGIRQRRRALAMGWWVERNGLEELHPVGG